MKDVVRNKQLSYALVGKTVVYIQTLPCPGFASVHAVFAVSGDRVGHLVAIFGGRRISSGVRGKILHSNGNLTDAQRWAEGHYA